ncbi:DUF420 domain-containing protein [Rhizosphaericola mali]|uniref:DUF420 domain-containing protein n=1 Tax=Rhizosphaericola mali TaxID=2545455 RepID=A0A5P2G847_9BACT|nr:DUF420 domain-containing protein [Rhizosphaericola mali]QES90469.1 DUF420 domain-containing protein [Rhizosphaericola mali]
MLEQTWKQNDKKANILILSFSAIVFVVVVVLGRVKLKIDLGFNVHLFALADAVINSIVALLLVFALIAVKKKKYLLHKKLMMTSLVLSILFLVSYICHRLLSGEARFGDANHDGILSAAEIQTVGNIRYFYYVLLGTHIFLAAVILPFILYTTYRAMTGQWVLHKKRAKYTWPLWFYVALTGPIVYLMIYPYYS